MRNPKKPIYAWSLDKTEFFEFPSQTEAAIRLCSSQPNVSRAARSERIIQGKYLLSYSSVFPGIGDRVHGRSVPVWVWDKNFQPIGNFASHQRAADGLGIHVSFVYEGVRHGVLVKGVYLFTKDSQPPAKIAEKVVPEKPVKSPEFELKEKKWVSLGQFDDTEAAAKSSGLSTRLIRVMLSSGKPARVVYRASIKKKKVCLEKQEFVQIGEYITLAEIAAKVKVSSHSINQTMKKDGLVAGKYKVYRIAKPIETASV